jgi:hypothetical protein
MQHTVLVDDMDCGGGKVCRTGIQGRERAGKGVNSIGGVCGVGGMSGSSGAVADAVDSTTPRPCMMNKTASNRHWEKG